MSTADQPERRDVACQRGAVRQHSMTGGDTTTRCCSDSCAKINTCVDNEIYEDLPFLE